MLREGLNIVEGIAVEVTRKRIRRINIRIGEDGVVQISLPRWWATLRQAEEFLREKWKWVLKVRVETLTRASVANRPVSDGELESLKAFLAERHAAWASQTGEVGVKWKLRRMKTVWGSCHWRERYITYNAELAFAPHELVDYVVAHEFAHFSVHGHGPGFYALMDRRLPGWKTLRKRLNKRDWQTKVSEA